MRLLLVVALASPVGVVAQDQVSRTGLLALTALELLNEGLQRDPDLTVNSILNESAGFVLYSRTEMRDSLSVLIDQVLDSEPEAPWGKKRAAIEAQILDLTTVKPDSIRLFTTALLTAVREALESNEEMFVEELLGDVSDDLKLDESGGVRLAVKLSAAAARELRPEVSDKLRGIPSGVYVLAVNFQASQNKVDFRGFKFGRWSQELVDNGTSYITESLGKSMGLKRKFRRIVPCFQIADAQSLLADYLLSISIDRQSWDEIQDTREETQASEDLLSSQDRNQTARQRRQKQQALQVTLDIEERVEKLPEGTVVWKKEKTVTRFLDELTGATNEDEFFVTRDGRKVDRNSETFGIMKLLVGEARMDVSRAR